MSVVDIIVLSLSSKGAWTTYVSTMQCSKSNAKTETCSRNVITNYLLAP